MSLPFAQDQPSRRLMLRLSALVRRVLVPSHWPMLLAVVFLAGTGLLTIHEYELTRAFDAKLRGVAAKQAVFLAAGFAVMFALQLIDYRRVGRFAWTLYFLSLLPLGYTVLGSIIGGENPLPGVTLQNGAYNWLRVAGMSFQPAEGVKVAFVLVLAWYLRFRGNYRTAAGLVVPFLLCLGPVILILKQPDLGTAMVFMPALLAMLFAAGARMKHILGVIIAGMLLVPVAWFSGDEETPILGSMPSLLSNYQRERVLAMFRDDEETLRGVGFQQQRALTAFGSGGVTGKGVGNIPVGVDVPEGQNDMIFAVIGEQFGFVGAIAVIGAYVVLFVGGVWTAGSTREPFGRLVAVGVVAMLAAQAFINIAVAMKIFPVTGITLPFVSAGGSSLIASFVAVGLILNIAQHKPLVMADDPFEFDD